MGTIHFHHHHNSGLCLFTLMVIFFGQFSKDNKCHMYKNIIIIICIAISITSGLAAVQN
jgi:hypothetical protein